MISLYSGLIPIIKQAAIDAVNATQPVQFVFGKVISVSPLKIQVTSKLILGEGNLVLAGSLRKFDFTVTHAGSTGSADDHSHSVNLSTTIRIDNSLKKGDSVILARMQGGDRYLVIDKAVDA